MIGGGDYREIRYLSIIVSHVYSVNGLFKGGQNCSESDVLFVLSTDPVSSQSS